MTTVTITDDRSSTNEGACAFRAMATRMDIHGEFELPMPEVIAGDCV
jgi:hypothetical protein